MIRAQQGLRAREENKALPGLRDRRVSRGQPVLRVYKACKASGERKDTSGTTRAGNISSCSSGSHRRPH